MPESLGYIHHLMAQKEALDRAAIVAFTDLKGTIVEINNMFCEISGYTRDELIGQNHRIVNSGHHPRSFFKDLFATVGKGGIWRNDIRNLNKKGEIYWVDTTIAPVRDEDGKIVRYMAIRFDITERKIVEEARKKALSDLNIANEELAQFAYRASHDLKSPITRSRELLEYVVKDIKNNEADIAVKNSERIVNQLHKLELLVVDILNVARADLTQEEHQEIDFEDILNGVLVRLEHQNGRDECAIQPNLMVSKPIRGERGRYEQIIYNLISNGIRYRDSDKTDPFVKISIRDHEDVLHIDVEDNGLGIPKDKHGSVFRMFEKFHPTISDGSGLGLSVVRKHVDALKGVIQFQSSASGTLFEIRIPYSPPPNHSIMPTDDTS